MNTLHKESIDAFLRVTEPNEKADSKGFEEDAEQKSSNDEGDIALVLRSKGVPFPGTTATSGDKPPFVVGLAHHRPSDVFILFAFTAQAMPCRLESFDRDGEALGRYEDDLGAPFLWGAEEGLVFMAAVNQCQGNGCGYFDTGAESCERTRDACEEQAEGGGAALKKHESAEFLRVVPETQGTEDNTRAANQQQCGDEKETIDDECSDDDDDDDDIEVDEEESNAIRTVIINELLYPPDEGLKFCHPDPNFLLPLSRSISKELGLWRGLCRKLPLVMRSREPPPPSTFTGKATDEGRMSGEEGAEFDKITSKRKSQFDRSIAFSLRALEKMDSHLSTTASENDPTFFASVLRMGKDLVALPAALEHIQQQHPESWQNWHEELTDSCDVLSSRDNAVLKPWLESVNNSAESTVGSKCKDGEKRSDKDEPTSEDESDSEDLEMGHSPDVHSERDKCDGEVAADTLIRSWHDEDQALLQALCRACSTIEQSFQTGCRQSVEMAHSCIKSTQGEIAALEAKARKDTVINTSFFLKAVCAPGSDEEDEEEEPWRMEGAQPHWGERAEEAHLSFGFGISEGEAPSAMHFVANHHVFAVSLRASLEDVTSCSTRGCQHAEFKRHWEKKVQPHLDGAMDAVKEFFSSGDLCNASLLIAQCLSILCDPSVVYTIRRWFGEDTDASKVLIAKFRSAISPLDIYTVKVSLAYFEKKEAHVGAHWFYGILKSGNLYFPSNRSKVHWVHDGFWPYWHRYSHPAAAIFVHGGWKHPYLQSIVEGQEAKAMKLSDIEAPVVIKERFNLMKKSGQTRAAIAFARVASGDHECMHFLFAHGLADEAMVQASASCNVEGLARLSKELISTNPCASVVCMQAHILGALESSPTEMPTKSIDNFAEIFVRKWLVTLDAEQCLFQSHSAGPLPSLHLLSASAAIRAFLQAAKSTSKTQALLDGKHFSDSGLSLAAVVIAVVSQTTPPKSSIYHLQDSIKYFLEKANLSRFLYRFGFVPASLGRKSYVHVCCALYEVARLLIEKGCRRIFCFQLALFSSVQVSILTSCEMFALDTIWSVRNLDNGQFEKYLSTSPMSILSSCYAALFVSKCNAYHHISESLLDSFLRVKIDCNMDGCEIDHIINNDVKEARLWMAIAYMHHYKNAPQAGALLVDNIRLRSSEAEGGYSNDGKRFECMAIDTLRQLLVADTANNEQMKNNSMKHFVESPKRKLVTELERNQMAAAYIQQIFEVSLHLSPSAISYCVRQHNLLHPSFWNHGAGEVGPRLSNLTGLALTLSKKKSLFQTCTVMYYCDKFIRQGQDWCNRNIVLECGISWLRTALSFQNGMVQFHNTEAPNSEWYHKKLKNDYTTFFDVSDWEYHSDPYYPFSGVAIPLQGRPKLAGEALITLLRKTVFILEEEAPELSQVCQEALLLCSILDFLLIPTPQRLDAVAAVQSRLGLREDELSSQLCPEKLATFVIDSRWNKNPDFSVGSFHVRDEDPSPVPHLVPRVTIATNLGKNKEAANLCVKAASTNDFWAKLSGISSYCGTERKARGILHSCLITLKSIVTTKVEVSEEFLNHFLHLVLSMNWLRACSTCSPDSSFVSDLSHKLTVSKANVALLHEIALAWNELIEERESPFSTRLSYCLNAVRCISRCIYGLEKNALFKGCQFCRLREEDYGCETGTGDVSAREERVRLRKRRKLQSARHVESNLRELEVFTMQLRLREPSDWCKDAIQRINAKGTGKAKQARMS